MKLFDIIPQNLFTILASSNREVYVSSLFVIRRAFKQEMSIRKDDLVSMLISSMDEEIMEMQLQDDSGEDFMICVKCKSKNVKVGVSVFMYIAPEDAHKLTKKALQKKSTELWGASWDKAQIVCADCGHVYIGC